MVSWIGTLLAGYAGLVLIPPPDIELLLIPIFSGIYFLIFKHFHTNKRRALSLSLIFGAFTTYLSAIVAGLIAITIFGIEFNILKIISENIYILYTLIIVLSISVILYLILYDYNSHQL